MWVLGTENITQGHTIAWAIAYGLELWGRFLVLSRRMSGWSLILKLHHRRYPLSWGHCYSGSWITSLSFG